MIREEGKVVTSLWKEEHRLQAVWAAGVLIWEAVKSCYGSGVWREDKPWRDDDVWR